jgi:restriction endonuclease S subunit
VGNLFRRMKLSEIGQIVAGGTPKTKIEEYWNGDVPWITPKDLSSHAGMYISRGERNISQVGLDNSSAKLLPKGTVLFTSRAPIGYVAIARNEVTTNQGFKSIIVNDEHDNIFTYYLLKNNIDIIENHANGSTFKEISGSVMKSLEFGIPSLREQKAIAHILSTLDDKIEVNNEINKTLENMAQAYFDDMFPNVAAGDTTIGEYITPKRGKNLLSKDAISGEVPVIAGGLSPATYHNVSNTQSPVITISASGANAGFVNLWTVPVWSSDSSFIDYGMTKDVYFWYVMLKKRQKEIYDSQTGSAQPHIYPKHITIMPTIKLNVDEINLYTKRVTPLFKKIANNLYEISKLQLIRDTLLPKLMSGEIRVPLKTEGDAS